MGRLEEALECALTYLLFHEGEEFVTENVEYYREELGHGGEPREVRKRDEMNLLNLCLLTEKPTGNYVCVTHLLH